MKSPLQTYLDRPKQYQHCDGTGEMLMGLMLLALALPGYLQRLLPEDSIWRSGFPSLLFLYAVLIPMLGLGFLLQRLIKQRITWPRTGYVAFATQGKAWWTAVAVTFLLAAVIGAVLAWFLALARGQAAGMGFARAGYLALWVALYAFWVLRMGRDQRWKWMILAFLALGLLTLDLVVPGGFAEFSRPVMLFVSLVWLGSGGATLFWYIRHTALPLSGRQ